jgi:DNA-3-methyladenine glycosylase
LLVRAVEPLRGVAEMRTARLERWGARRKSSSPAAREAEAARLAKLPPERIASGPGLVAAAFDLDRSMTGSDLLDGAGRVRLEPPPRREPVPTITRGPRVGIDYAGAPWTDVPWRLWIAGNPSVSGPALRRTRGPRGAA